MTRRTGPDAPKTVEDMVRVTGLGKDLVKAGIRSGELPGVVVGTRYVIPAEAFQRLCRGEWTPNPHPILRQSVTVVPQPTNLIRSRKAS